MKVTLVHPPQFVAYGNQISTIAMPPLGLAYLAGSLRQAGHRVSLVDGFGGGLDRKTPFGPGSVFLWGMPDEEIIAKIPKNTEVIGVGQMFSSGWISVRVLLKKIKEAFPSAPLIMGGEHASGLPEMCFEQSPIDFLVQGEGEETLVELAGKLAAGESAEALPGVGYRKDGKMALNPRRNRIRNVDDIPWPAWDLVDLEGYIGVNCPHGVARGRFIPMLATRGCPFQCTFCTNPQMWTQLWIPREVNKVVDEIEHYTRKYRISDIQFEDLTAIVRKDWIVDFCREILRRKIKITFQLPSGTRSEGVDGEVAALMKEAGCPEFSFAPESGDEETLKLIKKQVNLKKMYISMRDAMKAGVAVSCFFIVGFPHERWKHILNTYGALVRCAVMGIKTVSVNVFSPQPSTKLFHELIEQKKLKLDDAFLWSLFDFPAVGRKKTSFNPRFSDNQITAISMGGMFLFYSIRYLLRPHQLVGVFRETFGDTPNNDNRLGKYLRSMRKELVRSVKFKLRRAAA